jgi:predicted RNase H-like HicB family nuclease
MPRTLTAAVQRDNDLYVARALEVEVASQGETIEEALSNLREALELFFEDDDASIELAHPLVTTLEIGLAG